MNSIEPISGQQEKPAVTTYADLIIDYLIQLDVDYLFGVPGGAIEPLYNALGRHLREQNKRPSTTDRKSVV